MSAKPKTLTIDSGLFKTKNNKTELIEYKIKIDDKEVSIKLPKEVKANKVILMDKKTNQSII